MAGIRTPEPIAQLEQDMPHVYKELLHNCSILEHEFQDMQVRTRAMRCLKAAKLLSVPLQRASRSASRSDAAGAMSVLAGRYVHVVSTTCSDS